MAKKTLHLEMMLLVKAHAKAQGLTQSDLAKKMNLSVPTLKRWLAGSTITFEQLENLCKTLSLSVGELIVQAEDAAPNTKSYTREQEEFFVTAPDALAFFDQILQGKKVSAIKKRFHLTDHQIERYLSQLDKLGLIEWRAKNKVAIKFEGEPIWLRHGPLANHFSKPILEDFLQQQAERRFSLAEILPEDQRQLAARVDDVVSFISQCTRRAKAQPERAQSYGVFILCKLYRWQLDRYLMKNTSK